MSFTHGSLFSGIGGFDLAAEWMGWENVFHCEWNEFGQKILKYYWPKAISYNDITKTDFSIHRGTIDVLTGGFPCQPYSVAGKRKGKEDERHLWPEMRRAIREIQPSFVVGENVSGLVSWDGGMVFEQVQADLEIEGYETIPFLLPASGVNAPHQRERIWFIAYSGSNGRQAQTQRKRGQNEENKKQPECLYSDRVAENTDKNGRGSEQRQEKTGIGEQWNACTGNNELLRTNHDKIRYDANARCTGRKKFNLSDFSIKPGFSSRRNNEINNAGFDNFPTQSPVCNGDDGLSDLLDAITFPKWRGQSIQAGGNAIVPQVAYRIFKAIEQYEQTTVSK